MHVFIINENRNAHECNLVFSIYIMESGFPLLLLVLE